MNAFDRVNVGILGALVSSVVVAMATPAGAQQRDCNRPLRDAVMVFDVPGGNPVPTRDGCWIFTVFVDNPGPPAGAGVALVHRTESGVELKGSVPVTIQHPANGPAVIGIALTQDEKLLVVSHGQRLTFLDTGRMMSGSGDPVLGYIESPRLSRSWGVAVSADDRLAFASQQGTASVVIIDLEQIRKGVFSQSALVGFVPTAPGATTPVLSNDGRYLYTTTLRAPDVLEAPLRCNGAKLTEGAIQVADVQRARVEPQSATIGFAFPAGCSPVSMGISPDGARVSAVAPSNFQQPTITAAESSVTVFDARPVREGRPPTMIARIPTPPVPTSVVDAGDRLYVGFAYPPLAPGATPPKTANTLVLDASKLAAGKAAIIGTLPIASLVMALSPDGHTLFAAQNGWEKLAIVDLQRAPIEPASN